MRAVEKQRERERTRLRELQTDRDECKEKQIKKEQKEGSKSGEDGRRERGKYLLANSMVQGPATLQGFAIFWSQNWGTGEVFSWRVRDEQALFTLLLAFPAHWTLANRKFLGQIFPLRVF